VVTIYQNTWYPIPETLVLIPRLLLHQTQPLCFICSTFLQANTTNISDQLYNSRVTVKKETIQHIS
jgi:hypothetical protein